MAQIKHLEFKFSIARYELIKECEPLELKFYLWLKLWCLNGHTAWPMQATICKELGITKPTLIKLVADMEAKGRLKVSRKNHQANVYDLTWYDAVVEGNDPRLRVTSKEALPVRVKTFIPEREEIKTSMEKKNKFSSHEGQGKEKAEGVGEKPAEFDFDKTMKVWQEGAERKFRIIARFYMAKKVRYDSREQINAKLGMHVKHASRLLPFPEARVFATIDALASGVVEYLGPEWNLMTVLKFIDRDFSQTKAPKSWSPDDLRGLVKYKDRNNKSHG